MTPQDQQETRVADLADAFTPFAPRLDGYGFFCERQPHPGTTVRYLVKAKADETVIGQIFWDGRGKEYLCAVMQPLVFQRRWLDDMKDILVYLTQRQRRTKRAREER